MNIIILNALFISFFCNLKIFMGFLNLFAIINSHVLIYLQLPPLWSCGQKALLTKTHCTASRVFASALLALSAALLVLAVMLTRQNVQSVAAPSRVCVRKGVRQIMANTLQSKSQQWAPSKPVVQTKREIKTLIQIHSLFICNYFRFFFKAGIPSQYRNLFVVYEFLSK